MTQFAYSADWESIALIVTQVVEAGSQENDLRILLADVSAGQPLQAVGVVDVSNGNHAIPNIECPDCGIVPYAHLGAGSDTGNPCHCSQCDRLLYVVVNHPMPWQWIRAEQQPD